MGFLIDLCIECEECCRIFQESDFIDEFSHDVFDFFLLFVMDAYGREFCKWWISELFAFAAQVSEE
jgi:hypothetical protein